MWVNGVLDNMPLDGVTNRRMSLGHMNRSTTNDRAATSASTKFRKGHSD